MKFNTDGDTVSRFNYIEYTDKSQKLSDERKQASEDFENLINQLPNSREKSLALTKLEECFMWCGKAIRNLQNEELMERVDKATGVAK